MNIPLSVPAKFNTCLTHAIETALRDAGLDLATCRYTVLTEGLTTDGDRFAFSMTDAEDTETSRVIRSELVAMFSPAGPS